MRVVDAVTRFKEKKPCAYEDAVLVEWLNVADGLIWSEFLKDREPRHGHRGHHRGGRREGPGVYRADGDMQERLLVPEPYGQDVYFYYLAARVDELSGDMERYHNDMVRYNDALLAYVNWLTRERKHRPVGFVRV